MNRGLNGLNVADVEHWLRVLASYVDSVKPNREREIWFLEILAQRLQQKANEKRSESNERPR
jgi:hypothetical protein